MHTLHFTKDHKADSIKQQKAVAYSKQFHYLIAAQISLVTTELLPHEAPLQISNAAAMQ